jgi:hypothetical protein
MSNERDDLMSATLCPHDAAHGQDEAATYDPATHQHRYDLLIVVTAPPKTPLAGVSPLWIMISRNCFGSVG